MFDVNSLATNLKTEVEGVWRVIGRDKDNKEVRVKVARLGNEEYSKELRRKYKSNRAVLEQDDEIAAKLGEDMIIEVYATTILKDVENIGIDGQLITKYTPAVGVKLLTIKDFRERIKGLAEDMQAYQDAAEEKVVNG